MSESRGLPGYVQTEQEGRTAVVHPQFHPKITEALLGGTGCVEAHRGGRGGLLRCETERGPVLIRQYLRGGFIRHFLRDRYLLVNRPRRELDVHRHAYEAGVPVPLPVGAVWERRGIWYRGAFATLEIEARDLLAVLESESANTGAALEACGAAIRAMHDAGIVHGDLQVKNLLAENGQAWVVDFDKARRMRRVGQAEAMANLERLRRSFLKRGLDLSHFERIVESYGA